LNTALAPLFLARGRYREQLQAAERAGDIARIVGDDRMLAEAEVWRGCAQNQLGEMEEGRRVLERAIPLAEAADDLTSLTHALNDVGFLYEIGGEFARSRRHKHRALDIAERVGDQAAIANMTFRCGQNAFLSGDWVSAHDFFERSVDIARRVDASSILAYPLFGLGLLALTTGDWDAVTGHAEECLTIAARIVDVHVLSAGQGLLAEKELQNCRPEDARARLRSLKREQEGLDLHSSLPTLAEACLGVGEIDEAEAYVEEGMRKASTSHNRVELVDILRVRALTLMARERWAEAADAVDQGLRLARAMPYPFAVGRLLYTDGLLHGRTGEAEKAQERLEEAAAIFQSLGAVWHVEVARKILIPVKQCEAPP
jgi:tetratricopeptide (TPR) repeat protein